jgi:glycosyltransferase involved in cell wall biosynthesis
VSRARRVGIYTPCLVDGDAVGNDVMGMALVLERHGWDVRVFAETSVGRNTRTYSSKDAPAYLDDHRDLLIYHHSAGCPEGVDLLQHVQCRRMVKYHNVTPAAFFADVSALYERSCRLGREQLETLGRMGLELYTADSSFNAAELSAWLPHGCTCHVIPPFHHVERLLSVSADASAVGRIPDDSPLVLSVGRVAPNKNHAVLIDSVGFLNGPCGVPVRLAIVGGIDPAFERYVAGLRARIGRAGLSGRVEFLGKVSDAQLKACYQRARVLVTVSLHEGFCVPVVEAMAMGVPVVAYAAGAVAETVGDAGLVWDTADPEVLGASMYRVLDDTRLRNALIARGEARFQGSFTGEVITGKLTRALESAGIGMTDGGHESCSL